jgi:hypothetical protein
LKIATTFELLFHLEKGLSINYISIRDFVEIWSEREKLLVLKISWRNRRENLNSMVDIIMVDSIFEEMS